MTIRIWRLKLNESYHVDDSNLGHIIRASTETMARQAAFGAARDEGGEVWLNPKRSTCEHIKVNIFDGVSEIILTQTKDG